MQIWAILAQWFSRKKIFNDLSNFLHFYDYLPFKEDLALYLNNLEFPLPRDDLYQIWIGLLVLEKKIAGSSSKGR
jgi:hypothetical protein